MPSDRETDPVLESFLAFLAERMRTHPELIEAFSEQDVAGLDELLAGVEYDPNERLDEDFELP